MVESAPQFSALDEVFAATIVALGKSAPAPGTPRYEHLKIQIGVLLEDGKADYPSFLSDEVRDLLMEAIASGWRRDDSVQVVKHGYHGYEFASDEQLLAAAERLDFEDIVDREDPLARQLLEELSTPQAAAVVAKGAFNPSFSDWGLLGSISEELTSLGMPNPFTSVIDAVMAEYRRGLLETPT